MCGIAGIIGRSNDNDTILRMLDAMPYRGPDDRGVFQDASLTLGHLRLSIIDTSDAGHQPMKSADGRFTLIFNGEIYNYIELREELRAQGSVFHSATDSEVIIEAYRHFGKNCVATFNGMWAFALWDAQEKTLFLSRDRFGVKPLFYTEKDGALFFASEMKALLACVPAEPDLSYYYHFFDRRTPAGTDRTVFRGIHHLAPGHSLLWKNGAWSIERYFQLDPERARRTYDYSDTKATLRSLVMDAVKLRLRSDVPVGVCLSGGIDSSIIAVALKAQGVTPETFSSIYAEEKYSERRFIDEVNRATGAHPHAITPRSEDFFAVMDEIVRHHDEPVRMPGTYSHWHVMKCAQGNVTVLLDGQGADEVFAGYTELYPSYLASLLTDMARLRSPADARARFRECTAGIREHIGSSAPFVREALARLVPLRSSLGSVREKDRLFTDSFLSKHRGELPSSFETEKLIRSFPSKLDRDLLRMFLETNLPMLLRYEDRNSMAFSLEARVPFLDYRIVEFASGLSYREKIRGYTTKWLLREAFKDLLPADIYARKDKKGFPTPTAEWFRGPLQKELRQKLLHGAFLDHGIVRKDRVSTLLDEHASGAANHERTLFRLLTLDLWMRSYLPS